MAENVVGNPCKASFSEGPETCSTIALAQLYRGTSRAFYRMFALSVFLECAVQLHSRNIFLNKT